MATYRYRLIRTIRDEAIGVALEPPDGGLMLRLGQRDFDFDGRRAPKLEQLNLYIETISEKPEFRPLGIDNVGPVKQIDLDRFVSTALFFQKVKALAAE